MCVPQLPGDATGLFEWLSGQSPSTAGPGTKLIMTGDEVIMMSLCCRPLSWRN